MESCIRQQPTSVPAAIIFVLLQDFQAAKRSGRRMSGSGAGTHRVWSFASIEAAGTVGDQCIGFILSVRQLSHIPSSGSYPSGQPSPGAPKNDGLSPIGPLRGLPKLRPGNSSGVFFRDFNTFRGHKFLPIVFGIAANAAQSIFLFLERRRVILS